MKLWVPFLFLLATLGSAQEPAADTEDKALSSALAEAGSSQIDFVRALESHLAKYPNSTKKPEIERALVKAAIELKDDRRIVLYGEHVLDREPGDPQILDRVLRALLATDNRENSERALKYAKRYEEQMISLRQAATPGHFGKGDWMTEVNRGVARAIVLEARSTGNTGKHEEALALAQRSYRSFQPQKGPEKLQNGWSSWAANKRPFRILRMRSPSLTATTPIRRARRTAFAWVKSTKGCMDRNRGSVI